MTSKNVVRSVATILILAFGLMMSAGAVEDSSGVEGNGPVGTVVVLRAFTYGRYV